MAEGTKLQLVFETNEGKNTTMTFNYAKPSAEASAVRTLMQAIITNGAIFENVPTVMKSAKTITTSENVYDLSNLTREEPYTIPEAFERGLITVDEYIESCAGKDVEPDMALMEKVRKATEGTASEATVREARTLELK